MRILFLTQWFQPEPAFKGLPFVEKLKAMGYDVEVLTGFPNYPGGKVYPGYRVRLYQREMMDGVPIHRVALFPSHDRSGFKRIANYLSFGLFASVLGPRVVKKPDVVYVYNLITLVWGAARLKKRYGCRIVYDVQDLWPESVANSGMMKNRVLLWALRRWCDRAYRKADKIAVLSQGFKQALTARRIPEERIEVIYNWADESGQARCGGGSGFDEQCEIANTFNVVFAGTMGTMQGLDTVLDAAAICRDDLPKVRFVLVGGGTEVERLKRSAHERLLHNVVFIPRIPMQEMQKVWALAHTLLVHLVDDPLFRITIPSKTQAYLAVGLPVLMAVRGDAADLIQKSGGGVVFPPEDCAAMAAAVRHLFHMPEDERQKMGHEGKNFYARNLSMDIGCNKFLSLFE